VLHWPPAQHGARVTDTRDAPRSIPWAGHAHRPEKPTVVMGVHSHREIHPSMDKAGTAVADRPQTPKAASTGEQGTRHGAIAPGNAQSGRRFLRIRKTRANSRTSYRGVPRSSAVRPRNRAQKTAKALCHLTGIRTRHTNNTVSRLCRRSRGRHGLDTKSAQSLAISQPAR
jgi:hypothetical protein